MNQRGRGARTIAAPCLVALGLVAALPGASAQSGVVESLVTLQWSAPPEACPDAVYVYGEIGRLLGGASATAEDAHVAARARVEPTKTGYRVELATTVAGMKGSRTLDAQTCKGAANATALILALMVNPARVTSAAASTSSSVAVVPSEIASAPLASTSESASTSTSASIVTPPVVASAPSSAPSASPPLVTLPARTRWSLSEGAVLDFGSFPTTAFGAFAAGALSWGRARLELALVYLPRTRITVDGTSAGATFRLLGLEPRVGWEIVHAPLASLLATIGLDVSRIDATGFGVTNPSSGGAFRVGGALGALGSLRLSPRVAARLHVAAIVPVNRPDFGFDGGGGVHHEPAVTGRATLGLELGF